MARIVVVFDDLLLGSNIVGGLTAAGHDVRLIGSSAFEVDEAIEVVVVDVTAPGFDADQFIARLASNSWPTKLRTIALYPHLDVETRNSARDAGFDLVVPRSRFLREGSKLVERLLSTSQ